MSAAHTPGPWVVGHTEDDWIHIDAGDGAPVAMAVRDVVVAEGDDINCAVRPVAANARLIAAAPDLLEALKWTVGQIDLWAEDFCEPNDAAFNRLNAARAAIAKATAQ